MKKFVIKKLKPSEVAAYISLGVGLQILLGNITSVWLFIAGATIGIVFLLLFISAAEWIGGGE